MDVTIDVILVAIALPLICAGAFSLWLDRRVSAIHTLVFEFVIEPYGRNNTVFFQRRSWFFAGNRRNDILKRALRYPFSKDRWTVGRLSGEFNLWRKGYHETS